MSALVDAWLRAAGWLDAEPVRYSVLAWLCLGATAWLAFAPANPAAPRRRGRTNAWLFAGGVVLTLCAFRWPTWFVAGELNPDESQILAGAITLRHFPVYWKYVDGATRGPLGDYFLVLLSWFGVPLNYAGARFGAALLQAGALVAGWGALRCFMPERLARIGILPGVAFWCFTSWHDFINYSTEQVPLFLFSVACWLLAQALTAADLSTRRSRFALLGAGVALGAMPFGKLQAGPLGAAVALVAFAGLWRRRHEAGVKSAALALVAGGCAVPVLVGACLAVYGLIPQFRASYLMSNFAYVDSKPHGLTDMAVVFFSLIGVSASFAWFFLGGTVYGLLQARPGVEVAGRPLRGAMMASWLFALVAFFCVIMPGRELTHYLHLLVMPVTLLGATHLAAASIQPKTSRSLLLFGALTLAPQIWLRITSWHIYLGHLAEYRVQPPLPASRFLLAHARPGDLLAIWGWMPQVYVETGLAQGTRDGNASYQISDSPIRPFYRDRYLRDMQRRRPAWFLDAVGPEAFGFHDRGINGYETFPDLAAFISANYDFSSEEGGLRIYHLKPAGAL